MLMYIVYDDKESVIYLDRLTAEAHLTDSKRLHIEWLDDYVNDLINELQQEYTNGSN